MVETRNISLGGLLFHVELPAFEHLTAYLAELKDVLAGTEGADEIVQEVEHRLAELFQLALNEVNRAVTLDDVTRACTQLGDPSEFQEGDPVQADGDSRQKGQTGSNGRGNRKNQRRLFRDPDDNVFGGVAAGLAHRLDLDPVIVRAIFLVLGIFSGTGIPIYLLLWAIIPKARTAADRLAMKGDPVTVESIRSTVEDQLRHAREKLEEPYVQNGFTRLQHFVRRFFTHTLPAILRGIGKVLLWLVILSVVLGLLAIGALGFSALFGSHWNPFS